MLGIEKIYDRVYNEDVFGMLQRIPNNSVDLVYGDPDYNVGRKYNGNIYTKNFEEYVDWYIQLAKESLRILKEEGNMFFINYPKQNAYLRVKYLDRHCVDVNEYVWIYNTNIGHSEHRFTRAHRSILHCTKSKKKTNFIKTKLPNLTRILKIKGLKKG